MSVSSASRSGVGGCGGWRRTSGFRRRSCGGGSSTTGRSTSSTSRRSTGCCGPMLLILGLVLVYGVMIIYSRRSPHTIYRPEQIDVRLSDVVGIDAGQGRGHPLDQPLPRAQDLRDGDGRHASRACCSKACPAPARRIPAKAMAAEAGVPFLFVSATSFQSMFYGATAGKIRSYFKALRKTALGRGRRDRLHRGDRRDRRHPQRHEHDLARPDLLVGAVLRVAGEPAVELPGRRPEWHPVVSTTRSPRASAASSTNCSCRCSPSTSRWACRSSGERVGKPQLAAAGAPPAAATQAASRQHPADRGDQPGRLARPGVAAARPVRPVTDLHRAGPAGSTRAGRPLPGQAVAPCRA